MGRYVAYIPSTEGVTQYIRKCVAYSLMKHPNTVASYVVILGGEKDRVVRSLVPRPSPAPVFDRLQYAKTEPEGLVNLTT